MTIQIDERKLNDITVLALKGRLDSNTSSDLEGKLLSLMEGGENLFVLDFEEVDYISSAGLRVLIKAMKELRRSGGQLRLCSMKDYIQEVFDLCGFVTFLPIHPTLEASLEAF
jgi:anti-sigma B factor antagonist